MKIVGKYELEKEGNKLFSSLCVGEGWVCLMDLQKQVLILQLLEPIERC